jgi:TRAP-type mannitol/chloroaromatic compound transport system permease small subunit
VYTVKAFLSVVDAIVVGTGKVFSFLAVVLVGVITFEVTMRYGFGAPTPWGYEVITFTAGILSMMVAGYVLNVGRHACVDTVYSRFSPRIRAIMDLVTFPFFVFFCGTLLWVGADFFWGAAQLRQTTLTAWAPPIYPVKLFVPLGAFLILLQGLAKFIRDFKIVVKGEREE